jgi:L-threonylcarbamoyladenylate synthase
LILDGGPCRVGIESTVLDLTQNPPMILRPGGISRERIQAVIGPVDLFEGKIDESQPAASPGQQELHYSPQKPAFRFDFGDWTAVVTYLSAANAPVAILLMSGPARIAALNSRMGSPPMIFQMPANFDAYASRLYAALREADDANISAIWIELPPDRPEWTAVRDRILRATRANFGITGG